MRKRGKRIPSKPSETIAAVEDEHLKSLADSLRDEFDGIRDEPIPQNLQDLVDALRAAEKKSRTRH